MRIVFVSGIILALSFSSCRLDHRETDVPAYHNPTVQGLTDAISQNPENARLFFRRSEALMQINEPDLARKDLREAIRIDSLNPAYVRALGIISLQQNRPAEAIAAFQKSLKLLPGEANVRLLLSKAYLLHKDISLAQQEVTKVLNAAPDFPGARYAQAGIKTAKGDTAAAIAILEKCLTDDPEDYVAAKQLGNWLSQMNDIRAVTVFHQAFAIDTTDVGPLWSIGKFYEQRGQVNQAKAAYHICVLRDPDYTEALLEIGKILYRQDSFAKALRQFKLAVKTQPNSAEAYLQTGLCHEKLNQNDSARLAFNQALVFRPDDKQAKAGLGRLGSD